MYIDYCYNTGTVKGTEAVGGIVRTWWNYKIFRK